MTDVVGLLAQLADKLFGIAVEQRPTDIRISDNAKLLARQLAATFEEWQGGSPGDVYELAKWARKVLNGFGQTEPALKEIVTDRSKASRTVRRLVSSARGAYYDAADIINPLFLPNGPVINTVNRMEVQAKLRRAERYVRTCIRDLQCAERAGQ